MKKGKLEAEQLPSGNWRVRVMVNGKSHSVTRATRRDAERDAAALKYGILQDTKSYEQRTLRQLAEDWLARNEPLLSPSTVMGYSAIIKCHAADIADLPACRLTAQKWQASVNRELNMYAAKTVRNAYMFYAKVYEDEAGAKCDITLPSAASKRKEFLDYEQIKVLLNCIRGDEMEIPILMALSSLRRSEILAMRWENIDLSAGLMHVSGAAVPDKNYNVMYKAENKTVKSMRTVPIIEPLKDALEAQDDRTGLVCKNMSLHLSDRINTVLRHAGLPEVGCHGLRHSYASLCYHLNVPAQIAMEIGGWADIGTMQKIYTHIAQKDREHYTSAFTKFFEENG